MNLKTVKLLLTFFFLWVTTQFGIDIENLLAYIFVLSLGILHGSNDLKLIGNFSGEKKYTFRTKLSIYIFVVLFSFCFFLIFPSIGLLLFILFSGYALVSSIVDLNTKEKELIKIPYFYNLHQN